MNLHGKITKSTSNLQSSAQVGPQAETGHAHAARAQGVLPERGGPHAQGGARARQGTPGLDERHRARSHDFTTEAGTEMMLI